MARLARLMIFFLLLAPVLHGQLTSQQNPQLQKRLALIIGNGNYSNSILSNPENDAQDMSNILRNLGFEVMFHVNLGIKEMKEAIDEFGMKLPGYDVALFYFAGHGIQSAGRNYLVPVDAKLTIERMIQFDCIEVDRVLAFMEEAKTGVNIIILDACRNNPFEKSWSRALGGQGLASMDAPQGTLIAYATSPNKTASDGSGRNGLYTSAILESIINPEMTAIQIFQSVTATVLKKSNQQQMPWVSSSLTADFYFNPYKASGQLSQFGQPYFPLVSIAQISFPEVTALTSSGATIDVNITRDGGADIFDKGICYNTMPDPSIKNSRKISGEGGYEAFSCSISGLAPNKTYYARAYAINSAGTAYSPQITFTTDLGKPVISTENVTKVTSSSAFASGLITDDGGAKILLRGICWSTSPNPTVADSKTENGGGLGTFTTPVVILLPDTTYYLRAYCTNGKETAYGNEVVFRTLRTDQFMDVDGNIYGSVRLINLTWMTENLETTKFNDGTPIPLVIDKVVWRSLVSPAYCWYENHEDNRETFGALYNWEAVKSEKLCPIGWHVPTDEEWASLETAVGFSYAGGNLKERGFEHWAKPNYGIESYYNRFRALPGGERDEMGEFNKIGIKGIWWSSADPKKGVSWVREITSNSQTLRRTKIDNNAVGYSVRCVKDVD